MIKAEVVLLIKQDLEKTTDTIAEISSRYGVSKATVNNINTGKSHKEEVTYPIRKSNNYSFTDNEVAFIRVLAKEGYSAKQIHIILTEGSYSTISNLITFKTRENIPDYVTEKRLEERRKIFDFISTPHHELINSYTDQITFEDAVYIKLLGRLMGDMLSTLEIFLPLIESDMVGFEYHLKTKEDLAKYIEWGGTSFNLIWWIKKIFHNQISRLGEQVINYDLFPIARFKEVDPFINLRIIKEMIDFETKENYVRSDN